MKAKDLKIIGVTISLYVESQQLGLNCPCPKLANPANRCQLTQNQFRQINMLFWKPGKQTHLNADSVSQTRIVKKYVSINGVCVYQVV